MAQRAKRPAATGKKATAINRAAAVARKARREAARATSEVTTSAEARRAVLRARMAVKALGNAATAAADLIRTAWRTGGQHIHKVGSSRELRALEVSARRAAESAAATARAAAAAAEQRGTETWKRTVAGGKVAVSRARSSIVRAGRRLRTAANRK